jgi:hypothetical protein
MNVLPQDILYNIGSYVPADNSVTRSVVLDIDPYDPQIITDMLNLGMDPLALIAKERQRQQKERWLRGRTSFALAQVLYDQGQWSIQQTPTGVFVELLEEEPFSDDEVRNLGYTVIHNYVNGTDIRDNVGEDLFEELRDIDLMLYPEDIAGESYDSRGPEP